MRVQRALDFPLPRFSVQRRFQKNLVRLRGERVMARELFSVPTDTLHVFAVSETDQGLAVYVYNRYTQQYGWYLLTPIETPFREEDSHEVIE